LQPSRWWGFSESWRCDGLRGDDRFRSQRCRGGHARVGLMIRGGGNQGVALAAERGARLDLGTARRAGRDFVHTHSLRCELRNVATHSCVARKYRCASTTGADANSGITSTEIPAGVQLATVEHGRDILSSWALYACRAPARSWARRSRRSWALYAPGARRSTARRAPGAPGAPGPPATQLAEVAAPGEMASSRRRLTHFSISTATNGIGVTNSTRASSPALRAVVSKIGCSMGT